MREKERERAYADSHLFADEHETSQCPKLSLLYQHMCLLKTFDECLGGRVVRRYGTVSHTMTLYPNNFIIFLRETGELPFFYFDAPPHLYSRCASLEHVFVEVSVYPLQAIGASLRIATSADTGGSSSVYFVCQLVTSSGVV